MMPVTSVQRKKADREQALHQAIRGFISGFRRSQRGSLWREYDGARFVVFPSQRGGYSYLIVQDDVREFSESSFESEAEALEWLGGIVVEVLESRHQVAA